MKKIISIFSASLILFLFSCGGGSDNERLIYNTDGIVGDWSFSSICTELIIDPDTINLANELPDTISIFSNTDNTLSIDAGENTLNASIDAEGNFYIRYQSFRAYIDVLPDTATIYLTGAGNFASDSSASMDLTFTDPNLPGLQIDCSVNLSKLD